jgi:hypothetical protein
VLESLNVLQLAGSRNKVEVSQIYGNFIAVSAMCRFGFHYIFSVSGSEVSCVQKQNMLGLPHVWNGDTSLSCGVAPRIIDFYII